MTEEIDSQSPSLSKPSAPHDLQILLLSTKASGEACPIGFQPLCAELAKIWDVPIDTGRICPAPLSEEQKKCVALVAPRIKEWSDHIVALLAAPHLPHAKVAQVRVIDGELDDVKGTEGCIELQMQAERLGLPVPKIYIFAVERTGTAALSWPDESINTLMESKDLLTLQLGYAPTWTSSDGKSFRWDKHNLTLLQGANLRQTDNELWLKDSKSTGPSERTKCAAQRITDSLPADDNFNLINWTSETTWAVLSPEMKRRCKLHVMTNRIFVNRDGEVEMAANGHFDLHATSVGAEDRRVSETVSLDLHGSWMIESHTFNQEEGWNDMLDANVPNPELYRREIRRNNGLDPRWLCQCEAAIMGTFDDEYLEHVLLPRARSFVGTDARPGTKITEAERQSITAKHPWLSDTLNSKHYGQKKAERTLSMRRQAIVHNAKNKCNTTLEDTRGILFEGKEPIHRWFLPVSPDFDAPSKGEKLRSIPLDLDNPATSVAILGDDTAFSKAFSKILHSSMHGHGGSVDAPPVTRSKIIDVPTATSSLACSDFEAITARAINEILQKSTYSDPKDVEMVQGVLSACESGPMMQRVKSVLSGGSE